ncbi:hypothetical protein [Paraburkholderia phosphatilytica]|uniref:hypothetical protein n=1 Tax=Paraburkholderia phosphatilytica TaxID=2282883 RepID=UPI001F0CC6A8|nr:hypothetical protein [Paraburkholderia phosphatilytica]
MSDTNPLPAAEMVQALLHFLHRVLEAEHQQNADARALWLEAATTLHPLDARSVDRLMLALITHRQHDDAVKLTGMIAQLDPKSAAAQARLGYALQVANRPHDALAPYRRALAMDPNFRHLRKNLAIAIHASGGNAIDEMTLLEHAVIADPKDAGAWINLSDAARRCLNLERALSAGHHAVELDPHSAAARNNFAQALKEGQYWDDAEQQFAIACRLAPNNASLHTALAALRLLRGNFEAGWPGYEARWHDADNMRRAPLPVFPAPRWRGEPLAGKTLLVWGEQGMGDLLQFCRFVPILAERVHREGGALTWDAFPQMGALLSRSFGESIDRYSGAKDVAALPPFDYELPLVSIPLMLGTREATIPSHVPYLHADRRKVDAWRERLAAEPRLKVGLAWTGSRGHGRNRFRSVGWQRYAAAFRETVDAAFFSLQPDAQDDIAAAANAGLAIADHTREFASFDDTAAYIGALDLVITVCTSVAHLAGALGQRTWVLLDVNPYWPWMLERHDSPWYPTAKLYRQSTFADWDDVLDEVDGDLRALAAQVRR